MASSMLLDQDVDDLASLSVVDESVIVSILRYRYRKKKIFTSIGEILLTVNPFESLSRHKSDPATTDVSHGATKEPAPHISAVALRLHRNLVDSKRSQCCIFSGESGSGKTEASKLFLSHLMKLCSGDQDLERRIVIVNPLLEAFGNAKTSLNNNSSRFGKFIQLHFTEQGKVLGAKISEYLLEKSRVTHRNAGESNFHVFHSVMQELPINHLRKLKLDTEVLYGYLQEPGVKKRSSPNPQLQNYDGLVQALTLVGFSKPEQESIFTILAAILSLGNIRFTEDPGGSQPFVGDSEFFMKNAASLLKADKHSLRNQLQNLEIYSKGEIIYRPYTRMEAEDCRDSIAKALYNRLFGWIIHRINQVLSPKPYNGHTVSVGILDIFGFENLQSNSFEQLCINLANEHLHNFFNLKVFQQEQTEYQNEGLDVNVIAYRNNLDLLSLFLDRPIGILSLIDEESHFPQGSDASLVIKFVEHFGSTSNKRFQSSFHPIPGREIGRPTFTINHYAGPVLYDAQGFLEKNRDSLPERITVLLQSSSHPLVSSLFRADVGKTGSLHFDRRICDMTKNATPSESSYFARSTRKRLTLGYQFKVSLTALLERLKQSETYFVRCIKPNKEQVSGKFDSSYVLAQLRYSGVLETVWIRRQGFSYRPTFAEFMTRFRGLFNVNFDGPMTLINKILEPYGDQSWHLGKTKVFVKCSVADDLACRIRLRESAAKTIQRWFRHCLWVHRAAHRRTSRDIVFFSPPLSRLSENSYPNSSHSTSSKSENYSLADSNAVCQWFKDCVYEQLAPNKRRGNKVINPEWFYEDLMRTDSEVLLRNQPVGGFLVRSSRTEPTILVLSFRAPERCRHYLIDLLPHGKFRVRGELELHNSLTDLLDHHRFHKFSNYPGYLTNPCGRHQAASKQAIRNHPAEYDQLPPRPRRDSLMPKRQQIG